LIVLTGVPVYFFWRRRVAASTNPSRTRETKSWKYACTIKETTNGRWRRARGETRKAFQVLAQRRFKTNGKIDERKTIARICENEAQKVAGNKAKETLRLRAGGGGFTMIMEFA
jgi:hypothetical protein